MFTFATLIATGPDSALDQIGDALELADTINSASTSSTMSRSWPDEASGIAIRPAHSFADAQVIGTLYAQSFVDDEYWRWVGLPPWAQELH
jgi:hypothetical protein